MAVSQGFECQRYTYLDTTKSRTLFHDHEHSVRQYSFILRLAPPKLTKNGKDPPRKYPEAPRPQPTIQTDSLDRTRSVCRHVEPILRRESLRKRPWALVETGGSVIDILRYSPPPNPRAVSIGTSRHLFSLMRASTNTIPFTIKEHPASTQIVLQNPY